MTELRLQNYYKVTEVIENVPPKEYNIVIEGAILKGNTWLIPEDAKKPEDPRQVRKNGQQE